MARLGAAFLWCSLLSGCLDGSGDGSASGSAAGLDYGRDDALCGAHLAWDMACAELEGAPREGPFWGESECPMGPWELAQPSYIEAAAQCFETLPCEGSDDACTTVGLAALGIEDERQVAADPDYTRCAELSRSCDTLSEDLCGLFLIFTNRGRMLAGACLDLPCAGVASCLRDPAA